MATKLEIVKSQHGYKIISYSNKKHPCLLQIATLLLDANKSSQTKIGVFNVYGGEFECFRNVYSYISGKTDRLNKKQYYQWLNKGRPLKQTKAEWKPKELDLTAILEEAIK